MIVVRGIPATLAISTERFNIYRYYPGYEILIQPLVKDIAWNDNDKSLISTLKDVLESILVCFECGYRCADAYQVFLWTDTDELAVYCQKCATSYFEPTAGQSRSLYMPFVTPYTI